jgi:hypothetical protein
MNGSRPFSSGALIPFARHASASQHIHRGIKNVRQVRLYLRYLDIFCSNESRKDGSSECSIRCKGPKYDFSYCWTISFGSLSSGARSRRYAIIRKMSSPICVNCFCISESSNRNCASLFALTKALCASRSSAESTSVCEAFSESVGLHSEKTWYKSKVRP